MRIKKSTNLSFKLSTSRGKICINGKPFSNEEAIKRIVRMISDFDARIENDGVAFVLKRGDDVLNFAGDRDGNLLLTLETGGIELLRTVDATYLNMDLETALRAGFEPA